MQFLIFLQNSMPPFQQNYSPQKIQPPTKIKISDPPPANTFLKILTHPQAGGGVCHDSE